MTGPRLGVALAALALFGTCALLLLKSVDDTSRWGEDERVAACAQEVSMMTDEWSAYLGGLFTLARLELHLSPRLPVAGRTRRAWIGGGLWGAGV